MGLETFIGTYIDGLNASNPVNSVDYVSQGDDHIRGIKLVLQNTFPNITGEVSATQTELDYTAVGTLGTAEASKAVTTDSSVMVKSLLLDEATCKFADAADVTKAVRFELTGMTTGVTSILSMSHASAKTITIPDATDTLVMLDEAQTLTQKTLTSPVVSGLQVTTEAYFDAEVDNGDSGTADTIDWTAGNKQKSTMTADCTYTFSPEPTGPTTLTLKLVQGGVGSWNPTWPVDVKWAGGAEPAWSTAASSVDIVTFYYDGADFYGAGTLNFS